uniref:Uncharacterized protein n=1 Tax=Panagrolaimus davidi TaxID=227884 RepID=A0A914QZ06_9BILA
MLHVDNVNDFFCELRSGETTFKFKPDGEIIINREIQIHPLRLNELVKSNQPLVEVKNPDGTISKVSVADRRCTLISQLKTNPAAQAELDTLQASDREKLFQATHDIQKNDNIWTTVQSHIPIWKYFCPTHRSDDNDRRTQYAYFEKNYHLMFNVHCDDVKRDLSKILPEWSKDDMFCDLSPTELGKLSHVIKETNDPDIWKAAKVLAQNSGCSNVREFCDYVRLTKVIANEPFVRETAAKFQANGNQFDGKILQNAEVQAAMTTCINDYKNQIQHILSKNDTIWDNPLSATCHAVETCREENCEDKQISEKALKEFLLKEDPFDTKSLSSQHFRVETGYTQDGKERVTYVTNLNDLPSPPKPGVPESMQWTVKGVIADLAIDALTAATLTYGLLGRKFASTILKNPTSLAARLIAQRFGRTAAVRKTRIKRSVGFKKNVLPITTVKKVAQNTIAKGRRYKGAIKFNVPNSGLEHIVLCHGRKFAEHIDRFSFDYFDPEQKLIFDEIQAASDINQKQLLINRLHELITQNKTVENQLHLMQMRVVEFLKNHINAESYFASYKSNDQNINYLFKTDHHNVAHLITVTTTNRPFELDIASEKWLEITTAVIEDKDVVRSRLSAHA